MARFEHLMFVCTHERDAQSGKASCAGRGSKELHAALQNEVREAKLKGRVRVVSSGCLGLCSKGCAVLALRAPNAPSGAKDSPPTETWYTHLAVTDAPALFAAQVLHNGTWTEHEEAFKDASGAQKS